MQDFYDCGAGDRLVEPDRYPPKIRGFLTRERQLAKRLISNYAGFVEVGCMEGRNKDLADELSVGYLGVDLVPRYVAEARRRHPDARFACGDAAEVIRTLESLPEPSIAYFPFNSFGNLESPAGVMRACQERGLDALISTYQTTDGATAARRAYYASCEYADLRCEVKWTGVHFKSEEGLDSWAYHPVMLERMLAGFDHVTMREFAGIGILVHARRERT